MIQSFINSITNLTANDSSVQFQTDCIRTNSCQGCHTWLCHNLGSANYDIIKGGIYEIDFNATVSSATAGVVALGLYQDGVLIPGTTVIATIATAGDFVNVSFDKLIEVCCRGDANIYVASVPSVLTGTTAPGTPTDTEIPIIQNANILITKKC